MQQKVSEAPKNPGEDIAAVLEYIRLVKKSSFGEVRILVRNGAIYRILKTEEKLIAPG